jgi:hypothetical protein
MPASLLDPDESAAIFRHIAPWAKPTVTQIRNAVLEKAFITAIDPDGQADDKLAAGIVEIFETAVSCGRLFDMGHIQNRVIRSESKRAGDLFFAGHIGHPFRAPYCFFHTWDGDTVHAGDEDYSYCGSFYAVDPLDWYAHSDGAVLPGTFLAAEAQAVHINRLNLLMTGTFGHVAIGHTTNGEVGYLVQSVHTIPGDEAKEAAVSSVMDPIMTCLLLLATDGVAVRTIEAPEKLNRHRAKAGKPTIPSHYEVDTGPYVTALNARTIRRPRAIQGQHASPVPHLRRGHVRHLHAMHGGAQIWVRDAVINLKDPDAPLTRSFYQRRIEEAGHHE